MAGPDTAPGTDTAPPGLPAGVALLGRFDLDGEREWVPALCVDASRGRWTVRSGPSADELFLVVDDGTETWVLRVWRAPPATLPALPVAARAATVTAWLAGGYAYDTFQASEVRHWAAHHLARGSAQLPLGDLPCAGLDADTIEALAGIHARFGLASSPARAVERINALLPGTAAVVEPADLGALFASPELQLWRYPSERS